jgi:hypothetical protein
MLFLYRDCVRLQRISDGIRFSAWWLLQLHAVSLRASNSGAGEVLVLGIFFSFYVMKLGIK